jgi:hypothetical protein
METKKKKIVVDENTVVSMDAVEAPAEKLVVSQPKEEFSVLKAFTLDKHYHIGDVVSLSDSGVIKELKINKYLK